VADGVGVPAALHVHQEGLLLGGQLHLLHRGRAVVFYSYCPCGLTDV
jgi:hypothetical protein